VVSDFFNLEFFGLNCSTSIQASSSSGQSNLGPRTWIQSPGLGQPALQRYVRLVTQQRLLRRDAIFPQVFWTGATLPDGIPRNYTSALERLHDIRYRMVQRGLQAIGLQPHWGALRPGLCDLGS
jgi:hypothetical protein